MRGMFALAQTIRMRSTDFLCACDSLLSRAHSNYVAQINIRMNERAEQNADILGKLTVIGTIVLPMNIITGLWVPSSFPLSCVYSIANVPMQVGHELSRSRPRRRGLPDVVLVYHLRTVHLWGGLLFFGEEDLWDCLIMGATWQGRSWIHVREHMHTHGEGVFGAFGH
jgi:hypothetical protein